MRRVLAGDVLALAEAVAGLGDWAPARCRQLIDEAHAAHRYHRRLGRAHPVWGNGSLMARCLAEPGGRPAREGSAEWMAALAVAAEALARWRAR